MDFDMDLYDSPFDTSQARDIELYLRELEEMMGDFS